MGDPISAATITGTTTVFVALCTTFTLARFFERWHLHQRLWWDDCAFQPSPSYPHAPPVLC